MSDVTTAVWLEAVARSIPAVAVVVIAGLLIGRLMPAGFWRNVVAVVVGVVAAGVYLGATALQLPGVVPFIVGPAIFVILSVARALRGPSLSFLVTYCCYLALLIVNVL